MQARQRNSLRAGIVGSPEEYRWSSHRANAFGADDSPVTFHALYTTLGGTTESRCDAYRRMFERDLPEHELHAASDATQYGWALAGDAAPDGSAATRSG